MSDFWTGMTLGFLSPFFLFIAAVASIRLADATLYAIGDIWASSKVAKRTGESFQHPLLLCLASSFWYRLMDGPVDEETIFSNGDKWQPYFKFTPSKRLTDSE